MTFNDVNHFITWALIKIVLLNEFKKLRGNVKWRKKPFKTVEAAVKQSYHEIDLENG